MNKKLLATGAMLCAGVMCFSFAACGSDGNQSADAAFVTLDINPSVELTLDGNNKVVSVHGANEDGQVLLYGEKGIIGADVETAVGTITSLAVEMGYLDEENTVVQTSVTATKSDKAENILGKVNAKVTATAGELDLSVTCDGSEAYSLARKLAYVKAQYPDNEAIQALTPAQFKLVLAAKDTGEISLEAAAELDTAALIELVSAAHKQAEEYATAAYKQAKSAASAAYDEAAGLALDGIYAAYYTAHHPTNAYYGVSYQSYKLSSRSMYAAADAIAVIENACEYALDEQQIAAVSGALGLGTDVEVLKNSDGEITVNSIYAYADKQFKNSRTAADIEQIKAELDDALDTIENQLQAKIDELTEEYAEEIDEVKNAVGEIADTINLMLVGVPESVKEQLTAMVSDCREIAEEAAKIVGDGKITSDEVRALAAKLEQKAEEMKVVIESDLTEKELDEVKKLQDKAAEKLASAKTQMEKAIEEAEKQAKAKLEELKSARKADKA